MRGGVESIKRAREKGKGEISVEATEPSVSQHF